MELFISCIKISSSTVSSKTF